MSRASGAPRIVDRYAVFDAIASGGMASVHLGRLMGPVGFSRTVAIKRLHENFASDPEFVAMFLDEARLVARIRHPNVVPTVDVVAKDRELLLVMEYVAGETLWLLLKRCGEQNKPAPIPIVVAVMASVLNGLHAAHEATNEKGEPLNIVHRDVSPQNILVGTDGVARVLDFGVAKAVGRMQQTRAGQVKGKLRYMAPEQLQGHAITRASDIYAASIVLWEALTGERLMTGDNEGAIMRRILDGRVEPPSRLRPNVPLALDAIVLCGLERDPADRYATAKEMASALEAAVESVTHSAVGAWVLEIAKEEIQRRQACLLEAENDATPRPKPVLEPVEPLPLAYPEGSDRSVSSTLGSAPRTWRPPARIAALRRRLAYGLALLVLALAAVLALSALAPSAAPRASIAAPRAPAAVRPPVPATPVVVQPSLPAAVAPNVVDSTLVPTLPPSARAPGFEIVHEDVILRENVERPRTTVRKASRRRAARVATDSTDRIYRRD